MLSRVDATGCAASLRFALAGFIFAFSVPGDASEPDAAIGLAALRARYIAHASSDGDCAWTPQVITGVLGVKRGGDVVFTWDPDAGGTPWYNLWYVLRKQDIAEARIYSSLSMGVDGCSEPDSAMRTTCTDAGALARAPGIHFYQVRATCGGDEEGP